MAKLREVTFRLGYQRGFEPDQTPEQQKEQEEQERVREGYFHEWAPTSDDDSNGTFRVNMVGIVEEKGTGQIHYVFPDLIQFKKSPDETV